MSLLRKRYPTSPCARTLDSDRTDLEQILFALQFWYLLAVGTVKLSILCLYARIFSVQGLHLAIRCLLIASLAWLIASFFATLFQSWPILCNWDECEHETNYTLMYLLTNLADVLLDVGILCLPAFFLQGLQLSPAQRRGVVFIFGSGVL